MVAAAAALRVAARGTADARAGAVTARPDLAADLHPSLTGGGALLQHLLANHRRFLEFLERRVGSREDAEDILQNGFARVVERGAGPDRDESAVAWFYRLLRNAVVDYYRHRAAEDRAHQRAAGREDQAATIDDGELFRTVCACVTSLAATLKPEYSEALRKVEIEQKGVAEYAHSAGISPGNAAVRLHRARGALRQLVIRSCGTCAEHGCEDCRCREKAR